MWFSLVYYLRALGFSALDAFPRFFVCPEVGTKFWEKKKKSIYISLLSLLAKIKCRGVSLCLHLERDNSADHCSHPRLSGFGIGRA